MSAFGGWVATRVTDGNGTVVAGSTSAVEGAPGAIKKPSFTPLLPDLVTPDTSKTIQLDSVQFGRPMVLRTVSFSLGSEIPRPDRRADGSVLDPLVFSEAEFYLREPANVDSGAFYWSPHAETVYANQPGSITIQWIERVSGDIFEKTYTISGSPAKPAKKLYWTDGDFNGPLVLVPDARVSDINVIYTANFPERVASKPAAGNGAPPAPGELVSYDYDPENPFDPVAPGIRLPPETRTLWYDAIGNAIHAYNLEGRVFVELLGDLREPDRVYREHLGFEIVDVIKEVRPEELKVAIGERVLPVDELDLTPEDEMLLADVIAGFGLEADPYLFEHLSLGGSKRSLYAIRATNPIVVLDRNGDGRIDQLDEQQSNEVLIYWKESGVMRLEWPKKYVGYIFKWPEQYLAGGASESDLRDFYSLYARPEAGAGDYAATGVQLNSTDNPVLTYQDDPTRQHAHVTAQNVFYTTPGT
ncbi:MAG: hypothetical protein P8J87_05425, partial [Verrucomicrobiales bacterium]|nr:hypothetical protein [Verrucomicrobiales bacterium]